MLRRHMYYESVYIEPNNQHRSRSFKKLQIFTFFLQKGIMSIKNMDSNADLHPSMDEDDNQASFLFALKLVGGCILPAVLKAAIELGLLEFIKEKGPDARVSPAELAAHIPATSPEAHVKLDRILRLLSSYSILNCSVKTLPDGGVERRYSLAPVCKYLTKNEDGVSLAPLLFLNQDKILADTWCHIKEAILVGAVPFEITHKMSLFELQDMEPRFGKLFTNAMSNTSTLFMTKIVDKYNGFKAVKTLVDVGGGTGASLNMIISKNPALRGINFDLPHVVQYAPSYPGVTHVGGDMFKCIPKGDAIFLKWVLHNWDDEGCVKILKKCHEALPGNGKVVVTESMVSETPSEVMIHSFHLDVMMLSYSKGGKERTEREYRILAKEAGFKQVRTIFQDFATWLAEFEK